MLAPRLLPGICLTALLLGGCAGPEPFVVTGVVETPERAMPFKAGVATRAFTPEGDEGYPLGGFGGGARRAEFPFWLGVGWPGRLALKAHRAWHETGDDRRSDMLVPARGVHDDLTARALVLLPEEGPPVALVRIDAIGTTAELSDLVTAAVADLGYRPETVFLCATHTHSGLGAYMRHPFACLAAMDNFRPEVEAKIATACADAIREAHEKARPAALGFGRARDRGANGAVKLAYNRRFRKFRDEISKTEVDDEIGLLLVEEAETGAPLGLVLNYAVHPTVLGSDNLHFSADTPGAIERSLSARLGGAPVLFINGAVGDMSSQRQGVRGGLQRCRETGEAFAELIAPTLDTIETHQEIRLGTATGVKELGRPYTQLALGRGRFIDGDSGVAAWLTAPLALPFNVILWTLGFTDVRLAVTWNAALGVVLDLGDHVERTWTRVGGLRIAAGEEDVALLSLPGEATHDVGLALRTEAARRGATQTLLLGLSLDHIGYIASRTEYRRGGYEAQSTLFGERTAREITEAEEGVLGALGLRPPEAAGGW